MMTQRIAGADITSNKKWAVVVLEDGRCERGLVVSQLKEIFEKEPRIDCVGVDIPIGLPRDSRDYPRVADQEAKKRLGPAGSSVFLTLPRPVYECKTKAAAHLKMNELCSLGLNPFGWNLGTRILEADGFARLEDRVIEVHPEVTFWFLNGRKPLGFSKKSWNGQQLRRALLEDVGVCIPATFEDPCVGGVPPDDILDAAAAAWTAYRFASGKAESLGEATRDSRPNKHAGRIWY